MCRKHIFLASGISNLYVLDRYIDTCITYNISCFSSYLELSEMYGLNLKRF